MYQSALQFTTLILFFYLIVLMTMTVAVAAHATQDGRNRKKAVIRGWRGRRRWRTIRLKQLFCFEDVFKKFLR
jgi:hypothetical protein